MPYVRHTRWTALGVMHNSSNVDIEQFSYSFATAVPGTTSVNGSDNTDRVETIGEIVRGFHVASGPGISSSCILQGVKAAFIDTDGTYVDPPAMWTNTESGNGGGASGFTFPLQVAARLSVRGTPAVHTLRGGFYLPCPTKPLADDGRWSITSANQMADAFGIFIGLINSALQADDGDSRYVIASSKSGLGNQAVLQTRVGRVPDTIRRRRNELDEDWQVHAIDPDA